MPQRSLSEEPRTMFRTMLPVANVFAVLVAADIAEAIYSASAASIYLGISKTRAEPSLISRSVSGSEKYRLSKVIEILSGVIGSLETAPGLL